MGLFGPPNVERLKARKNVKGLIKSLDFQKDSWVCQAADWALGQIGNARIMEPIKYALKGYVSRSEPSAVRLFAATALGQIGGAYAVEPLIAVLSDKSWGVQRAAAMALGQIGDARAVEPLIAALKDKYEVQSAAATALGQIGDARAVEPLIAALTYGKEVVRKAATEALDKLGWQPDQGTAGAAYWIVQEQWDRCVQIGVPAVEPLIVRLQDYSHSYVYIGKAVASALGKLGDTRAVEPLLAKLKDLHSEMRQAAVEALGQIGDIRAVDPLIATLMDTNTGVRNASVKALVQIGMPAIAPLILALNEGDQGVCQVAAKILDKIGWKPDKGTAGAAYWIARKQWGRCVQIGAPAVEPLITALTAAFKNNDRSVCKVVVDAMGQIGDARAVEPLTVALKDKDQDVRNAAEQALVKIGKPSVEQLVLALKVGDQDVCQVAAKALDKLGWQPDQGAAGAVYWIVQRQWDRCVQIGTPAVKPLIPLLQSTDLDTRKSAAGALMALYQSGRLDEQHQRLILLERSTITKRHEDHTTGSSSDCNTGPHLDTGIGYNFPV